jgi:hypothetical protein
LLERLREEPGPHEREAIERLLVQIDSALSLLRPGGEWSGVSRRLHGLRHKRERQN